MTRYCPICNKSSDDINFVGELCMDCALSKFEKKINIPETLKINICRSCGKVKTIGDLYEKNNKKNLAIGIEQALGIKECTAKVLDFSENFADVQLRCEIDGQTVVFQRRFAIKVGKQMCKPCSMKSGGYFEALVQLRGNDMKAKKMMERLERFVARRDGFISKTEEVANGYDVYVSSKSIVSAFMHAWSLKPTRSFQLFSKRAGKEIYRNIYSLRF